ncbi:hypothetical protein F-S17_0081 [Faustovirus]|nr:hypothetical protein F-S17_0081 [Faustovirus]
MSRPITLAVNYGRHRVSAFHPTVSQLVWPIDALGEIMHGCTNGTKLALGATCHALHRLLRSRIDNSDIHLEWPHVCVPRDTTRKISRKEYNTIGNYVDVRKVHVESYAKLIPPACENCRKPMHTNSFHTRSRVYYWQRKRGYTSTIYVGDCSRTIWTYLCYQCNALMTAYPYNLAVMRLRMSRNIDDYDKFYTSLIGNTTALFIEDSYSDNIFNMSVIICKYATHMYERKYIRKAQLLTWARQVYEELAEHLTRESFPFHALSTTLFKIILWRLKLRDIMAFKCTSRLQKIIFTGAERLFKHAIAQTNALVALAT